MIESTNTMRKEGRPVYLVDGSRAPFLKVRGAPGPFKAADLAVAAARPLLLRQPFERGAFDEVILGCITPAPDEVNIGRVVSLRLGIGERVPAWTVQRNCASGLQALDSAWRNVAYGYSDLVLAGGVEAMSHAPVLWQESMVHWLSQWSRAKTFGQRTQALRRIRPGFFAPVIGLLKGLTDPVVGLSMGQTAENLAWRFGISREEMDTYAVASHKRLTRAQEAGLLEEVETVYDAKGGIHERDDGVRPDSSVEALARLKPAFDRPFGHITAGNSAQITDGAAWLIVASEAAVESFGLEPMGRIVDTEWAGVDPAQMGLGPVHAVAALLRRQQLTTDAIDYWELNEAFAAQVLACLTALSDDDYCRRELGWKQAVGGIPLNRLNVDGGGISLGHPVGASGARIVLHLLHVLRRNEARYGIATLCIGGGQGGAMLVENVSAGE